MAGNTLGLAHCTILLSSLPPVLSPILTNLKVIKVWLAIKVTLQCILRLKSVTNLFICDLYIYVLLAERCIYVLKACLMFPVLISILSSHLFQLFVFKAFWKL